MNPYLYVATLAAFPGIEVRGSIPLGLGLHLNPLAVILVSLVANLLIIPILFSALKISGLRKLVFKFFENYTKRKINKNKKYFEIFSELALIMFVAIPLPSTGVYTGTLIAEILGLNRLRSGLAIALGGCIAVLLVFLASVGIISII